MKRETWQDFIDELACPRTKQPLVRAEDAALEAINEAIGAGSAQQANGEVVTKPVDALLVREDGAVGYAVRGGVVNFFGDEAIVLS